VRQSSRGLRAILALLSAIVLSVLAVGHLPVPLAWIGFGWGVALLFVAVSARHGMLRYGALGLAGLGVAIGFAEIVLSVWRPVAHSEMVPNVPYPVRRDDVLGYAPLPNHHWVHRKLRGGTLLFSAENTTDPDGLRVMPEAMHARASILLFGGSFTFGEAVNDDETLGWQIGQLTGGRYRVHTFAYNGYGPHQMLAAIEAGRVDLIVKFPPRLAVFQLIPGHPVRAAGRASWDRHGPRYVLERDGSVVRRGNFDDHFWSWQHLSGPVMPLLWSSQLGMRLLARSRPANQDEIELTAAIIARSRDLLRARWPGLELYILYWQNRGAVSTSLREAAERRGLEIIPVADVLPPSQSSGKDYRVPGDGHPNARCYREMARSLVAKLLDPEETFHGAGIAETK